ncbi:WD40 repeat domain-containing serine/threonine protein kinase [Dactylosporangium sucinum]|nr:protein kinase [Dactylosporangium sucinum]
MWRTGETILDLYEVLDVIRSGGMGLVYRVRHHGWGVDLAVKTPRPGLVDTADGRELFQAEAESWVALGVHPHIVNCAYVRRVGDVPAVFAEWVDGGSLSGLVRDGSLYSGTRADGQRRALDVAVQGAWGLAHAHAHDLVHQDVKPANVMLTADGTAKVTDFGLAKARAAAGERPADAPPEASVLVTYGGMTPAYCSPEQASGGRVRLSRATDVWSWGLSVLELFAGRLVTRVGAVAGEAFEEILADGGRDLALPLPDGLVPLLRECFRPDPAARPRMAELADRLAAVYADTTGERYPRTPPAEAALRADGLSNRALSMLDLGHAAAAEELWEQALRADPHHVHTVHNRGLYRWRAGRIADTKLLAELAEAGAAESVALVERERGESGASATLRGHQTVSAVAISRDGRFAATGGAEHSSPPPPGSEGGAVRVWDIDGERSVFLPGHPRRSNALAFSGDARLLASAGDDRLVLVWGLAAGTPRHRLEHPSEPRSVALTADGGLLVSTTMGGGVYLWSTADGRLVHRLQQEGSRQYERGTATFSADDRHVVAWSPSQARLRVWEAASGMLVRSGPLPSRSTALLTPGAAIVVAAGEMTDVDPVSGAIRRTWPRPAGWPAVAELAALDAAGRWLLHPVGDTVEVWDLAAGRCLRTLSGHDKPVQGAALDAAGRLAISGGWDGTARLWRLTSPGPPAPWSYARPRDAAELHHAADRAGALLDRADAAVAARDLAGAADALRAARAVPGHERDRRVVDRWAALAATSEAAPRTGLLGAWPVRTLPKTGETVLSPDGRLAVLRTGHSLPPTVVELATGEPRYTIGGHGDAVTGLEFTPDARTMVTSCDDQLVRVLDAATGECRHVLKGHRAKVSSVAVGADGRHAVTAGADGTLRLWDIVRGRQVKVLQPHPGYVYAVALPGPGRIALAKRTGGDVCVLDTATGQCRLAMPGRSTGPRSVAVTPDGRAGFAPSLQGSSLWRIDLSSGELGLMTGHSGGIVAVAAAGDVVLSAADDGTVRVWDAGSGECRQVLTGHTAKVTSVAPTADGWFALSGSVDGTVRAWDLRSGRCLQVLQGPPGTFVDVWLSADARTALATSRDDDSRVWELDWDRDFSSAVPLVEAPEHGGRSWLAVRLQRKGKA